MLALVLTVKLFTGKFKRKLTEVRLLIPLPQVALQSPHSVKGKNGFVAPTHSIVSLPDPAHPGIIMC